MNPLGLDPLRFTVAEGPGGGELLGFGQLRPLGFEGSGGGEGGAPPTLELATLIVLPPHRWVGGVGWVGRVGVWRGGAGLPVRGDERCGAAPAPALQPPAHPPHPPWHRSGRGVGSALVAALLQRAGGARVLLLTLDRTAPLYLRQGFVHAPLPSLPPLLAAEMVAGAVVARLAAGAGIVALERPPSPMPTTPAPPPAGGDA